MIATELRIGNLVLLKGIVTEVGNINEFGINITVEGSYYGSFVEEAEGLFIPTRWSDSAPEVMPIPLTEDWLIKFGFNVGGGYFWQNIETESVYIAWNSENKCCYLYEGSGDGASYGKPIKTVHQLQNVYYALTNAELTLTHQSTK